MFLAFKDNKSIEQSIDGNSYRQDYRFLKVRGAHANNKYQIYWNNIKFVGLRDRVYGLVALLMKGYNKPSFEGR